MGPVLALPPSCVTQGDHCTFLGPSFSNYKMRMIILALLTSRGHCQGHLVIHVSPRLLDTKILSAIVSKFLLLPPRTLAQGLLLMTRQQVGY